MMPEIFTDFTAFIRQCSLYFSVLFGRWLMISFLVLGIVLILRCSILKNKIFLKGMLWSIFLLVPFAGKLELFYSTVLMCRIFLPWHNICCEYPIIGYCYLFGIVISGVLIFLQHRKMYKHIKNMEQITIDGRKIYISEIPVTPFTMGIFRSKIVIPRIIKDTFEPEKLQTVLLHERTHIRLGHLWFFLIWDILRILLWPNPLFTYCMRYFKEDMEDVCDRITIRNSNIEPYEYGLVLLKSIKLLKAENTAVSAAFIGERDYREIKKRFIKVTEYKPYRKIGTVILSLVCMLFLVGMFMLIKQTSYPKYIEDKGITLTAFENDEWECFLIDDSDTLKNAFYSDDKNVYIDKTAFRSVLREYGINENIKCFYLGFNGYAKLQSIGGSSDMVFVDYGGTETELIIPYVNRKNLFFDYVYKYVLM